MSLHDLDYFSNGEESIYICPPRLSHLGKLPWGSEQFDVFFVILDLSLLHDDLECFLAVLVKLNNDWIETFGIGAEQLHDQIDRSSVAAGRQTAVCDGSPMTAWHEDIVGKTNVIEYIKGGGHGHSDNKLVLLVGSNAERRDFILEMKDR